MSKLDLSSLQRPIWIASFIALILLSAALLKWLSLPKQAPYFYAMVGGLEAILAVALMVYRDSWRVWTLLTLMLATWSGFSFYTTFFGLPCSCLGSIFLLPRGISLSLNGLMLAGAWHVLTRHPSHPAKLKRMIWFFTFFFIFGFVFSLFYYNYQT